MELVINGSREHSAAGSILDLLNERENDPARVVVELNGAIVAAGDFAGQRLNDGDRIEIVQFVGGG